jgi:hypothetical protein
MIYGPMDLWNDIKGGYQVLGAANQVSPTAGSLWSGTPISNMIVGKPAYVAEPEDQQSSGGSNIDYSSPGYKAGQQLQGTNTLLPISGGGDNGGGNGGNNGGNTGGGSNIPSMEDQLRGQISSAWDQWTNEMGNIGNQYLPEQRTAQENIANTQLQAGQGTINTQKAASLRDIANTTKNAFQAGNIYLGLRGAGDSSAANQYNFAVSQEAAKQSGQLNEFVNTQMNNLQSTHDQQIQEIALWFSEKQQAIKEAIANGQLNKSQDINNLSMNILNNAISAANQVKADTSARYNALVEWAGNNSTNLQQLGSNIRGIPQAMGNVQMDSSGNIQQQPVGQLTTKKKTLFG